jgi:hypothetical protein
MAMTVKDPATGPVRVEAPGAWNESFTIDVTDKHGRPMADPTDGHWQRGEHIGRLIGVWALVIGVPFSIVGLVWLHSPSHLKWHCDPIDGCWHTLNNAVVVPNVIAGVCWLIFFIAFIVVMGHRAHRKHWWNNTIANARQQAYLYVPGIDEMINRYSREYGRPLSGDEINVLYIKQQEYQTHANALIEQLRHEERMAHLRALELLAMAAIINQNNQNRRNN